MPNTPISLPPEKLTRKCHAKELRGHKAATGDACANPELFLGCGQDRFLSALELCVKTNDMMHNVYVSGLSGSAGFTILEGHLKQALCSRKRELSEPNDWCYVYNFKSPHCPLPVALKKGTARTFRKKVAQLLDTLQQRVPKVLDSEQVKQRREKIEQRYEEWMQSFEETIRKEAKARGLYLDGTLEKKFGFLIYESAVCDDEEVGQDKILTPEESQNLSPEQLRIMSEKRDEVMDIRDTFIPEQNKYAQETNDAVQALINDVAQETIEEMFQPYYKDVEQDDAQSAVRHFYDGLRQHAIDNFHIFVAKQKETQDVSNDSDPFLPWQVNVFVEHNETEEALIVSGRAVSIADLSGSIERTMHTTGWVHTNHMKIHAGAFHKANGGILVLSARDVFSNPDLWKVVTRVIKNQEIAIETKASLYDYESLPLNPVPISANVRIVLFGPSWLMNLLAHTDDEFTKLFKIRAELLPFVDRTKEQVHAYHAWIERVADKESLHTPTQNAACAIIEHAGRLVNHQRRLSTDFDALEMLLRRADTLISSDKTKAVIRRKHVEQALEESFWRSNAAYEYVHGEMNEGILLISTAGRKEGQINAMTIVQHGDVQFGIPKRVTARAHFGKPGIVNIIRAAERGGSDFVQADLIVAGLLEGTYAQTFPLSLKVHLMFEQTYAGIDGDSASLAEYFVLLSAIAQIPIKQSVAITGSVNLHGDIQPIGGVNQKVEGFFDTCCVLGDLSGEQGVIIPYQNAQHLMLNGKVVEAAGKGKFHIWPIETLEQGVEILMDISADELKEKVEQRLEKFFKDARSHYRMFSDK